MFSKLFRRGRKSIDDDWLLNLAETSNLSALSSFKLNLAWPTRVAFPARSIDAHWLISRLFLYQAEWKGSARRVARDKRQLAGDLFAAGMESDTLAWIYCEPRRSHIDDEVLTAALAEFGVALLDRDQLRLVEYRDACLAFLAKEEGLDKFSRRLYGAIYYDRGGEHLDSVAYSVDTFCEWGADEAARVYAARLAPFLEVPYKALVAQAEEHLSG